MDTQKRAGSVSGGQCNGLLSHVYPPDEHAGRLHILTKLASPATCKPLPSAISQAHSLQQAMNSQPPLMVVQLVLGFGDGQAAMQFQSGEGQSPRS